MNLSIVPKWVWVVIALAVLGGVAGSGIYAIHSYNDMATKLSEETSKKNTALEANKLLQTEIDRLKQDVLDRQAVNEGIATETAKVQEELKGLSSTLDAAIAERDEARRKAQELSGTTNVCKADDALSTVPTEPDIGLDYAWQVYCKTNPKASVCVVPK